MLQQYRHEVSKLLKSKSKNSDNYERKLQLLRDLAHRNKCMQIMERRLCTLICAMIFLHI